MRSYKIRPLVSGLFHLALGFQDLLMLWHVLVLRPPSPKLYSLVWTLPKSKIGGGVEFVNLQLVTTTQDSKSDSTDSTSSLHVRNQSY